MLIFILNKVLELLAFFFLSRFLVHFKQLLKKIEVSFKTKYFRKIQLASQDFNAKLNNSSIKVKFIRGKGSLVSDRLKR